MSRRRQDQFGASCKFGVIVSLSSSTAFETLHIDRILMIITYTPLKIAKGTYRHGRNEVRASAKLSLPRYAIIADAHPSGVITLDLTG